jgi:hypothetical protein
LGKNAQTHTAEAFPNVKQCKGIVKYMFWNSNFGGCLVESDFNVRQEGLFYLPHKQLFVV